MTKMSGQANGLFSNLSDSTRVDCIGIITNIMATYSTCPPNIPPTMKPVDSSATG